MNKFFITALLTLSNVEADSFDRILRQGGRNKLAKLQNMIDTECTDTFTCPVDPPSLDDCTFEKPERPSFEGLTQEEIQQLKEDFRAEREERKEQILTCACCGGFTLDKMLPFAQGGVEGEAGSGRPDMFGGGGSRPKGAGGKLAKLQDMIDTECTGTFVCPVDPPSLDECTFEKPERPSFEGLTQEEIQQLKEDFRAQREERKEQILTCACCGGFTLDEMLPFAQGGAEGEVGSGRPGMFGGGGSRPEGSGRPGMFGGGGRPGRGGGLRKRQSIGNEVEIEESVSSADENDYTSGDESPSSFDF